MYCAVVLHIASHRMLHIAVLSLFQGYEDRPAAEEQAQKSQSAASLFGGITPMFNTSYKHITPETNYSSRQALNTNEQPFGASSYSAKTKIDTGIKNLTVEDRLSSLPAREKAGKVWSQSARNFGPANNDSGNALFSSYPQEELAPMEFHVEPTDNNTNQFKPDLASLKQVKDQIRPDLGSSNPVGDQIKPDLASLKPAEDQCKPALVSSEPADERTLPSENQSDDTGLASDSASGSNFRPLYGLVSPSSEQNLQDVASQKLLTASTLASPDEFEGGNMYAGLTANDLSNDLSPDDYVNVPKDMKERMDKVVKSDSYHSSPCKSVASMDTDSIEEA